MDEAPIARTCPQCGQPLTPGAESCANCGRDEANPFTAPAAPLSELAPRGFSLRLLFTVVTVICVSLAVGVLLPGLGVILGMVFVPAVVRAAAVMKRGREAAGAKSKGEQIGVAVLASAGVTLAVWLASAIAFVAVCTPVGFAVILLDKRSRVGGVLMYVLGGLAGLVVFFWFMRRFWPRAKEDD